MADWLYVNRDALVPELASIHMLVSDAEEDCDRIPYVLQHLVPEAPVFPATRQNVKRAGEAWVKSFRKDDSAFCFVSGHGAVRASDAVVFLSDLNTDPTDPWGAHLNVSELATAFKAKEELKAAYFFTDACQEFSSDFVLSESHGVRIVRPLQPRQLRLAREKVLLISAASAGTVTYEGDWPRDRDNPASPCVTIGRFTQVLIDALDGASARYDDGKWVVDTGRYKLHTDLKFLYGRRSKWAAQAFNPVVLIDQNNYFPLVCPPNPRMPVFVITDPEHLMASYRLHVDDDNRAPLVSCPPNHATTWMFELDGSPDARYVVAVNGMLRFEAKFWPVGPNFLQRISVS
ncbi:caspase family protein [Sinorhizobium meliloti]|uniref:caspase family protein n=1 Tax=Rhizobium meliloti TaxID=382 RepID=UPI00299D7646